VGMVRTQGRASVQHGRCSAAGQRTPHGNAAAPVDKQVVPHLGSLRCNEHMAMACTCAAAVTPQGLLMLSVTPHKHGSSHLLQRG
jgi:hypothetical protein